LIAPHQSGDVLRRLSFEQKIIVMIGGNFRTHRLF